MSVLKPASLAYQRNCRDTKTRFTVIHGGGGVMAFWHGLSTCQNLGCAAVRKWHLKTFVVILFLSSGLNSWTLKKLVSDSLATIGIEANTAAPPGFRFGGGHFRGSAW